MRKNFMLPQSFFTKDALVLAPALLGCILVHESMDGTTAGMIVETECYSEQDAASHSYRGETERTRAMFGPGGHAYIYFTYGMHYCFNVVSGERGHGQGVLIRALEPIKGIELMRKRRGLAQQSTQSLAMRSDGAALRGLCNGPAKLVQAMGITKDDYGKPLFEGNLYIKPRQNDAIEILSGPRIGIKKALDKPWRFRLKSNPYVSKT